MTDLPLYLTRMFHRLEYQIHLFINNVFTSQFLQGQPKALVQKILKMNIINSFNDLSLLLTYKINW